MTLRDLEYFLAVVEHQHFGRAAKSCAVSQPTLSGQIKKLEESLGVLLFERSNRRVMVTDAGRMIAQHAHRVMTEVDEIRNFAQTANDPLAGKFKLGAFPTVSAFVFPRIVSQCRKSMPSLRLILIEEKTADLLSSLRTGRIDAALLALPIDDDAFDVTPLFEDEFLLAVQPDHPLKQFAPIDTDIPSTYPLLLLEEGHCLRDQSLDVCQTHGIGEEQDFKATSLETLREMVKAGTGITLIPRSAIRPGEKGIEYLPFRTPAPKRTIALVTRKTSGRQPVFDRISSCFNQTN